MKYIASRPTCPTRGSARIGFNTKTRRDEDFLGMARGVGHGMAPKSTERENEEIGARRVHHRGHRGHEGFRRVARGGFNTKARRDEGCLCLENAVVSREDAKYAKGMAI